MGGRICRTRIIISICIRSSIRIVGWTTVVRTIVIIRIGSGRFSRRVDSRFGCRISGRFSIRIDSRFGCRISSRFSRRVNSRLGRRIHSRFVDFRFGIGRRSLAGIVICFIHGRIGR